MPNILEATGLTLVDFHESDRDRAFALYETSLRPIIDEAFGWDSDFQLNRFSEKYPTGWFHWIHHFGSEVGFVSFYENETELHLSLLILKPDHQNRGFGHQVMQHIHSLAGERPVTLSSFQNNAGAIRFYKKLGYRETGSDPYFSDFSFGK